MNTHLFSFTVPVHLSTLFPFLQTCCPSLNGSLAFLTHLFPQGVLLVLNMFLQTLLLYPSPCHLLVCYNVLMSGGFQVLLAIITSLKYMVIKTSLGFWTSATASTVLSLFVSLLLHIPTPLTLCTLVL